MAQTHKLESEIEVKCSADKLYGMYTRNATQLPKYVPRLYKSIQVIEGDGNSVGTVRSWKCALGESTFAAKERTIAIDNKNRSISYSVFEGEIMNIYKSFEAKLSFTPKGDGISLVKCSVEFEKANENAPTPTAYIELVETAIKELAPQL